MNLNYVNKRPSGVGGLNIKKKEEMYRRKTACSPAKAADF